MRWYLKYASPARLRSQSGVAIRTRNNDTKKAEAAATICRYGAEAPLPADISAVPEFSKHETQANCFRTRYYPPQRARSGSLSAPGRKTTR